MTGREYDLREDVRSLMTGQWLKPGETLRAFTPTGRGNYRSDIRGYPSAAWKAATALGWAVAKLASPLGIIAGGAPYWNELRRFEGGPAGLIAFGDGKQCQAARLLGTGPHRSGIWILANVRFGFAADRVTSVEKAPEGLRRSGDLSIVLDKVIEVPSTQFAFEDRVSHGSDVYLRIRFHDGSGVDLHPFARH
ncbi:hypothetical protein [Glycomyces sp. YM15]|uniref:hypothetical protein n=1 Tax=Glycomyces sp. YM15 TaxID=2800446 RepID=UPI001964945D|nr:hypothetical protein [Glycomyces sp. YM15]